LKGRLLCGVMPKPIFAGADAACGAVHLPFEQIVGHLSDQFQGGAHFLLPVSSRHDDKVNEK
jgi:hypothetical protein